jgi:hypothetical protein
MVTGASTDKSDSPIIRFDENLCFLVHALMAKKFNEDTMYLQMYLEAQSNFTFLYYSTPRSCTYINTSHHYTTTTPQKFQSSHVNDTASLDCTHRTQSKLQLCRITDKNKKHKNQLNYVL